MRKSVALFAALLTACAQQPTETQPDLAPEIAEQLWHHRNLGKAFYENPVTQYEAVGELKAALDLLPDSTCEIANHGMGLLRAGQTDEGVAELERAQRHDPSLPHTWFNLGIAYLHQADYTRARQQFERMVELVPDEPISHYNLGTLYKLEGLDAKAVEHFERSAELDPNLAAPHFQLTAAYRKAGRGDESKQAMARFRELKKQNEGAAVPEDLEWSFYAELCSEIDPRDARDDSPPAELAFERQQLGEDFAGLAVVDFGGDGTVDLLAWSATGVELYAGSTTKTPCGLEELAGVLSIAPGDFDNDGLVDLAVVSTGGAALYRQENDGFRQLTPGLDRQAQPALRQAVWLDYDHDYDIDLFLLGANSALLRNNGEAGWSDRTADFPFVDGEAVDGALVDVVADTHGADLAVVHADRGGVLYRDLLAGKYEAVPLDALAAGLKTIAAFDVDNDGWTDLVAGGDAVQVLVNDRRGGFAARTTAAAGPFVFADLENRGLSDLVTGGSVFRNQALGELADGQSTAGFEGARSLAAADFDADGDIDLASVVESGSLVVLRNQTATPNRSLTVSLGGVKNLQLAPGAEVEVKAGRKYQKKIYQGLPLHFGLGGYAEVDAVRITWPNGLIQNETRQATGQSVAYEEAQRLSGSCPMIFTWNGREFEFITDVLGVAPLGAAAGDGEYFPVDHDEYVQIAGESLVARDGQYEIRVTEELREVAFLDEIRLVAADHPDAVEVFTNDKFKGPPFPEFRLFGVTERVHPTTARDHHGQDVRQRLLARDQIYPDGFARDYAGVAELHRLDLDFTGAGEDVILVLAGWLDWADGSTYLGASQQSDVGLVVPYLQVRDAAGRWRTVIEDMGLPAGKPKTIVVDLAGKFLSESREVRIVTNLCLYWDEIFLAESQEPEVRLSDLAADQAELRYRGFSRVVIHPQRKQPERFIYAEQRPLSMWNPTRGLYTRYGDVRPLLGEVDDRFVIMGSGDEIRLLFDATALPELPSGWRRDFLLLVDGWAKDGDANTAHSQTVEPLPYHGMPQYPYEAPHRYPDDGEHKLYREHYNTRPALRLIRPLAEDGAP